jgi:hypothetical protein
MRNMRDISIRIRSFFSCWTFALVNLMNSLSFVFTLELCLSPFLYPIPLLICGLLAFKKTLLAYSIFSSFSFLTWCVFLLKLLNHIDTIILRRLHFSLLLQLVHFKFKLLDFSLQVIIFEQFDHHKFPHSHDLWRLYCWLKSWRCLTKEHQITLQDLDVSLARHHVDLEEHQLRTLDYK